MLTIRVDGNSKIGSGHVMRCLSIAEALREMGEETVFVTADDQAIELISKKGFRFHILGSDWEDMEGEVDKLVDYLDSQGDEVGKTKYQDFQSNAGSTISPVKLLIDSYQVTKEYLNRLKEKRYLYYIDDFCQQAFNVHALINYNIYASEAQYHELYKKQGIPVPQLWMGSEFAPLRSEFWQGSTKLNKKVTNILISTGGGDQYNITGQILQRVLEDDNLIWQGIQWNIISGTYNKNKSLLLELKNKFSQIVIHENVTEMAKLMRLCDIAIAAGGSTMYELAAVGIPTICFSFVDNQDKIVESFGETVAINAGKYLLNQDLTIENILNGVKDLIGSYPTRQLMNHKMKEISDGRGAIRLAELLSVK